MAILQLLNVNFLNNDYNHTLDFEDLQAQTDYFGSLVNMSVDLPTTDDYVYIREHKQIRVDASKSSLDGVNYLRFNNGTKWWYAFITRKDYVNEYTTDLFIEIDVLQTFMFDYQLKESFITREHQDRWEKITVNNVDTFSPLFNLKEEDIDIGSDYFKVSDELVNDTGSDNYRVMCALIVSTKELETGGATVSGFTGPTKILSDPLFYYAIPLVNNTYFSDIYYNSNQYKAMTLSRLVHDMGLGSVSDASFQNQINLYSNIVSINILPYIPFKFASFNTSNINEIYINSIDGAIVSFKTANPAAPATIQDRYLIRFQGDELRSILKTVDYKTFLSIPTINLDINSLKNIDIESKLLTSPYSYLTLDDNQTEPLQIKPECVDKTVSKIMFTQSVENMPTTRYYIDGYLNDSSGSEYSLINNNINNINLASNKLADYLNDNRSSATTGLAVNTGLNLLTSVSRLAVGVSTGNPFAISNTISDTSSMIKNVSNEIFKRKDLLLGSPNYKDKSNHVYSYFQHYLTNSGLHIKKFKIIDEFKNRAFEYFYHYGYACKDFKTPDIRSRYYFNFIQSPDMCLDTGIDNEYITKIKSIFKNGITFWHYRDQNTFKGVENYDYENVEMSLIPEE